MFSTFPLFQPHATTTLRRVTQVLLNFCWREFESRLVHVRTGGRVVLVAWDTYKFYPSQRQRVLLFVEGISSCSTLSFEALSLQGLIILGCVSSVPATTLPPIERAEVMAAGV